MPPKSRLTENEILSPSTLPSAMAISEPSGPVIVPVSLAPSVFSLKTCAKSPLGVESEPVQVPSAPAAKAVAVSSRAPTTVTRNFEKYFFIRRSPDGKLQKWGSLFRLYRSVLRCQPALD